jgi:hypothetical protein
MGGRRRRRRLARGPAAGLHASKLLHLRSSISSFPWIKWVEGHNETDDVLADEMAD